MSKMKMCCKVFGKVTSFSYGKHFNGWLYAVNDDNFIDDLSIIIETKDKKVVSTGQPAIRRLDFDHIKQGNMFGFLISLPDDFNLNSESGLMFYAHHSDLNIRRPIDVLDSVNHAIECQSIIGDLKKLVSENSDYFTPNEHHVLEKLTAGKLSHDSKSVNFSGLSSVHIPIGCKSSDGSTIVGKDGYFFLYRGSNDLVSLYSGKNKPNHHSWLNLIKQRKYESSKLNCSFLQLIIPEKQTLLHSLYPFEKKEKTITLHNIEEESRKEDLDYILTAPCKLKKQSLIGPFRKVDSHLTTDGAASIVKLILSALNVPFNLNIDYTETQIKTGDLGDKFEGPSFFERLELYFTEIIPTLVESFEPENGQHIGILRKWENPKAPNNQKMIVFGNSFFERGANSTGLSWWFSRLFSEFHFYWSPECDWDIIEKEKPDILICQTIERFLTRVPNS